jgi:hypothetical protein
MITELKIITLSQVWQFVVIDSCIDVAYPRYPTPLHSSARILVRMRVEVLRVVGGG